MNTPYLGSETLYFCWKSCAKEESLARMVMWVFGYGSLVWRSGFDYDQKIVGFIKGYRRVFHLARIDHRGTLEFPARTYTLGTQDEATYWGTTFYVRGGREKERLALEYLERRECENDIKTYVDFYHEADSATPLLSSVLVFISIPDIKYKDFLGLAPLEVMSSQIARVVSSCRNNRDYLF